MASTSSNGMESTSISTVRQPNRVGAPSLLWLSRRTAIKHVDDIQTFADLGTHLLPPIIRKISSPSQLRNLEIESPQIVGHSATVEQWKALIRRDIPQRDKQNVEPRNPASWWKVYRKLKREDDEAQKVAEEQLRQALGQKAAEKQSHQSTILHSVLPEAKTSTKYLNPGTTKKTVGLDALKTLRKQAANGPMSRSKLVTSSSHRASQPVRPAHLDIIANRGTVSQAPSKMLHEYARKAGVPSSALPPVRNQVPTVAPRVGARKSQARNPFKKKKTGSNNRPQQEALDLAIKVERQVVAHQKAEAERRLAEVKSEYMSPQSHRDGEASTRTPQKKKVEEAASKGSPSTNETPAKRKAPSIFMAQKKRKV